MPNVMAESATVHHSLAWWQHALIADGQSWLWVGTLIISLTFVIVLILRYLLSLWCLHRIRLMRGRGLVPSSDLRAGQCAQLQLIEGSERERLHQWRTMIRKIHPDTIEVDMPLPLGGGELPLKEGCLVSLAINTIDSLCVMETEVIGVDNNGEGSLRLRRQPVLHRLQRREYARVEITAPATVEVLGGKGVGRYAGRVMDIGGGGMCIRLPVAPSPGATIRVEVPSLTDIIPQPLQLLVVGVSKTVVEGHLEYRLHCAFADLTTEQIERVARFVHQKQRELVAEQRWDTAPSILADNTQ